MHVLFDLLAVIGACAVLFITLCVGWISLTHQGMEDDQ